MIPSVTKHVETSCGTMHLTLGYDDEKLVEVKVMIGKNGCCPNVLLDTVAKVISMYLQSPEPRYKVAKKFKNQFVGGGVCGNPFKEGEKIYKGCVDYITSLVAEEMEK